MTCHCCRYNYYFITWTVCMYLFYWFLLIVMYCIVLFFFSYCCKHVNNSSSLHWSSLLVHILSFTVIYVCVCMWSVLTHLASSLSWVVGGRSRQLWKWSMTCCSRFSSSVAHWLVSVPTCCQMQQWNHNCIRSLKLGQLQQEKPADFKSVSHFILTWHAYCLLWSMKQWSSSAHIWSLFCFAEHIVLSIAPSWQFRL